ncbi:MAG: NAD(P)-dependent oxidoreductase [Anaerolineae bacterium]|nr:NAD(P)-dependent oxidoreductase [Anaerolineae bacterium]
MQVYPKIGAEDPSLLELGPDRYERTNIPAGAPPEQPAPARLGNFDMVFTGYGDEQAVVEAMRCIHCPSPEPCILGCPVHNDIPSALLAIEEKDFDKAANIFRATHTLPEVCGRLCPQEILCEGSCTVAGFDRAVNIGKLENFCTNWQRTNKGHPMPALAPSSGRRVAVVGSGPAGLAAAEELARDGHQVVVYEEWPQPGGLLVYGIPGFKLSKEIASSKCAHLERLGVKFVCNTKVGRDIELDALRKEFDAVFLGIGAPIGHSIGLPGQDLKGVYQATEFLVRGNLPSDELPQAFKGLPEIGSHVVVIGGGDTSADCVRTARRLQIQHGFPEGQVTDYYRGAEQEMSVREEEYVHAQEEGVKYEFHASPVRFIGDDQGHVRFVEMQKMRSKPADKRQRVPIKIRIPIPGSNFTVPADIVVLAIGYGGDPLIPSRTPELKTVKPGIFQVDSQVDGATTLAGVYAGGDDVRGADLIVTAVAAGRHAAWGVESYLKTLAAPAA